MQTTIGSFEEARKHLAEFADDEYSVFRTRSRRASECQGFQHIGEYTVNETYTPSAEINAVAEFYVNIDRDSRISIREYIENDTPFEAYLKLQKKDKDTGKLVTFSNATFKLSKYNEETKKWERQQCKVGNQYFDTWTTNELGIVNTETKMQAGRFKMEEISVPNGFLELEDELIFNVNNRNKTLEYDSDWDAWITVVAENRQPKGKLEVSKSINLREDSDVSLIKDIDYTKISFRLITAEDIIDYADRQCYISKRHSCWKI